MEAKMRRYFNTEGQCEPEIHYMVRLDDRLDRIRQFLIDRGKYFVINRGRQYGKTTMLCALEVYLREDYLVASMDFQGISTLEYSNEFAFTKAFMRMFTEALEEGGAAADGIKMASEFAAGAQQTTLGEMFYLISRICGAVSKPIVLMIDEVDSAGNNQVFIDFLALLRKYYIKRKKKPIFHSVILAGVYDIKNLKLKLRSDEEHQYNSPWNIAADFDIDMSFSADQIAAMLREYETDNRTGMDIMAVSGLIYQYTSGYPYLVSAICKLLDERISQLDNFSVCGNAWSQKGITEAVKHLLNIKTPLFESMIKQLDMHEDLRKTIERILYKGERIPFSPDARSINLGIMFSFLKEENGQVVISNRVFEMRILNMFIAEEALDSDVFLRGQCERNMFIKNAMLDMDLVLAKFVEYFTDIYGDSGQKFIEDNGRRFFLFYLKPIINGTGNYYLEAQTRDARRTDVVVDYLGEQFIVELKIWHGDEYNERGEKQLAEYLDYYHKEKGYLLSFNFNKKKEVGVKELKIGDKTIIEAVV